MLPLSTIKSVTFAKERRERYTMLRRSHYHQPSWSNHPQQPYNAGVSPAFNMHHSKSSGHRLCCYPGQFVSRHSCLCKCLLFEGMGVNGVRVVCRQLHNDGLMTTDRNGKSVTLDHVLLREHVPWCHHPSVKRGLQKTAEVMESQHVSLLEKKRKCTAQHRKRLKEKESQAIPVLVEEDNVEQHTF